MALDVSAGRGGKRHVVRPSINVTPLVDVVLVLLIIFMILLPIVERVLEVRVPEQVEVPAQDVPPQLRVHLDADGTVRIDGQRVAREALSDRIRPLLRQQNGVVFFAADDDALYRDAVEVMDSLRGAGARTIGTVLRHRGN